MGSGVNVNPGRLLCVGVRGSGAGDASFEADLEACARAGVGAVILFDVHVSAAAAFERGGMDPASARAAAVRNILSPRQLTELVAALRERLGAGLLLAIDQEGGRVARLAHARGFEADPSAAEFAALSEAPRRTAARRHAQQLARLGIDLNFAPCVDLAIHRGGVIAQAGRSFGCDPQAVAACAREIVDAHRAEGVAACLKHFPGHGSAPGDTHLALADITATHDDRELEPYRALLDASAVMVGHLLHRGVDADRPASLSRPWIHGVLRQRLGFTGVVATDSIDMRAVRDRWPPAEACVLAARAGADLIVHGFNAPDDAPDAPHPAPAMAAALERAIESGELPAELVATSAKRLDRLGERAAGARV